jgi:hypothetical protein
VSRSGEREPEKVNLAVSSALRKRVRKIASRVRKIASRVRKIASRRISGEPEKLVQKVFFKSAFLRVSGSGQQQWKVSSRPITCHLHEKVFSQRRFSKLEFLNLKS